MKNLTKITLFSTALAFLIFAGNTYGNVNSRSKDRSLNNLPRSAKVLLTSSKSDHSRLELRFKKSNGLHGTCRLDNGGWQCFIDCVGSALPPDVILTCADSCNNGQWSTCATCLGVGLYVVVTCGAGCYGLET